MLFSFTSNPKELLLLQELVKWVQCHHGMECSQAAGGDGLRTEGRQPRCSLHHSALAHQDLRPSAVTVIGTQHSNEEQHSG